MFLTKNELLCVDFGAEELLRKIGERLCYTPEGFKAHAGLKRQLKKKMEDAYSTCHPYRLSFYARPYLSYTL